MTATYRPNSPLTFGQLRSRQAQDKSVKKADTETVIDMAELGARVAKRKAALGIVDPANPAQVKGRNSGERRTESKKALLKAIKDIGGKW